MSEVAIGSQQGVLSEGVSLSKVMDSRSAGSTRANTAGMTEMVSATVFPASRAARVTRDLRSWRTSTGRVRLQMMRSPSQWPPSILAVDLLGPFVGRLDNPTAVITSHQAKA
jgi:hypothetical protein